MKQTTRREVKAEFTETNLSGGDDDHSQRTVGPLDLRLHGLKTLDQRDGVRQGLTCRGIKPSPSVCPHRNTHRAESHLIQSEIGPRRLDPTGEPESSASEH